MQPSGRFNFEDVTLNGFNYKRTTNTAGEIFPLYSDLDKSIAYTLPQMESYRSMTPTLINKAFPQRSYTRGNYYQEHYSLSPGGTLNRWSTVGEVHGTGDDDASCVIYWTFTDQDDSYYFNGNEGNSVIGDDTLKFVSGFDISHVIFESSITGYTKAQYDAYKSDGSSQTAATIDLEDLIANPGDYYIKKFEIHPVCYWDAANNTWRSGSPVYLTCLVDGGSLVQGVSMPGCVLFCDQQTSASDLGINCDNYHIWSNTQNYAITDSTQYVRKGGIPVGLSSNNPYSLGTKSDWFFEPTMTVDELDTYIRAQVSASSNNVTNPKAIFSTGHGEAWGYDNYNVSKKGGNYSDVPGAFYYSKYDKVLTYVGYGTKLSEFLASAGCYFHIGATNANYNNTLNNNNVTPDTLYLQEDIGLGVMADDGTTTGTWIIGEDIEDYDGINKKGDVVHPGFNPSPNPPIDDEDNEDAVPTVGVPFAAGLAHYYVTTAASPVLEQISEAMSTWDINTSKKDLYRNLISCKLIKPPAPIPSTPGLTFTIYGVQPEYQGSPITITGVAGNPTASFGPYNIDRKFNDFRDYAPYSKAEIFLPYCGWCGLPSHVIGRSVTVDYYTDIIAATCKAVVWCGSNIVAEASGVIGVDIPFASENVGAKMQAANAGLVASTKGALQTALGVGTLVASKGQKGVNSLASGLSNYISGFTQMSMAANENWTEINGQTGDGCNLAGSSAIIIKITRPKKSIYSESPYVPAGYAHNIGFTSMKGVSVGSVSGLLIADNVDTSGISGATERERAEIKRLLETGIIV